MVVVFRGVKVELRELDAGHVDPWARMGGKCIRE